MKDYVEAQQEEIRRALSGRGQYCLRQKFNRYGVQAQTWAKMRSDQREKVVLEFMKARLPKKQKVPVVSAAGSSLLLHDDTSNKESLVFDISSDDSGITSIPIVTLEGMWHKAEDLVNASNSITPAPGMSKKDKMVMSYSQVKPHYVQYKDSGQ